MPYNQGKVLGHLRNRPSWVARSSVPTTQLLKVLTFCKGGCFVSGLTELIVAAPAVRIDALQYPTVIVL